MSVWYFCVLFKQCYKFHLLYFELIFRNQGKKLFSLNHLVVFSIPRCKSSLRLFKMFPLKSV